MRRIARRTAIIAVALSFQLGCQTIRAPWSPPIEKPARNPLDRPTLKTYRDAVPDRVMLGDPARTTVGDGSSGP